MILRKIFTMFLFCLICISCDQKPSNKKLSSSQAQKPFSPPPVQVEVGYVKKKKLVVKVNVVGTTLPYRRALLSAAISGKIIKIHLEEGKLIRKNQPIIQVDTYTWKSQVNEREAQCARWQAEIDKLKSGFLKEEILRAKAELKEKEVTLNKLDTEKKRAQNLLAKQGISQSEWDEIRYSYAATEAQVQQMSAELARMNRGARTEDIAIAVAQLESTTAQLMQAKNNLEKTKILAPFTGIISKKHVEIGEWISEGKIVAELVDLSKVKVEVSIAEKYISLVRPNMKANIKLDAFPQEIFTGTVTEIIPKTEGFARNFPVRLVIDNPDKKIMEGMFCRVEGVLREDQNVFMIHRDAFIYKNDRTHIALVNSENIIEMMEVSLGVREGEWFEIISPANFEENTAVVITNNNKVYPGAKVIAVNRDNSKKH